MQTVRQLASGIVYAMVSLLLVIGSLSLSLAQGESPAAPTQSATALSTSTSRAIPTTSPTTPMTPPPTAFSSPTTTATATVGSSPIAPTSTYFYPSVVVTLRATSTRARTCGPLAGWTRSYVVQPGDTLYRIATMHNVGVEVLKRANCKTGTLIYVGELLWVPYVLPAATELTVIPTFPSPTEPASATATVPTGAIESQSPDP